MNLRLGYVAINLNLQESSPSKTITLTNLNKIDNYQAKVNNLKRISKLNLENTLRILKYNKAKEIHVYRLTSKLIPLATHPDFEGWDYIEELRELYSQMGEFIKQNDMRVSAHPDHFTLLNSLDPNIYDTSVKDLEYHDKLFEAMGLDSKYKLCIHLGGLYKNKEASIQRFTEGFLRLPKHISSRIMLENDDKSYTAKDILEVCKTLKIPMVLDVHHFDVNHGDEKLEDILGDIFKTWDNEYFPPKIHISSPKNEKDFRSHADNINPERFVQFLNLSKAIDRDFDVMIEAKDKDNALFKLVSDLKTQYDINFKDSTTIAF